MKSGLEGRNNRWPVVLSGAGARGLNEVRPGRPEQSTKAVFHARAADFVSMKSGLEGRNNGSPQKAALTRDFTSTCELSASPGPIKPLC